MQTLDGWAVGTPVRLEYEGFPTANTGKAGLAPDCEGSLISHNRGKLNTWLGKLWELLINYREWTWGQGLLAMQRRPGWKGLTTLRTPGFSAWIGVQPWRWGEAATAQTLFFCLLFGSISPWWALVFWLLSLLDVCCILINLLIVYCIPVNLLCNLSIHSVIKYIYCNLVTIYNLP